MRSAPSHQPGVDLGDDPDLPAELGQRLAATAQTAQGVMTNYLFYGQRCAAEDQAVHGDEQSAQARPDEAAEATRAQTGATVRKQVQQARTALEATPSRAGGEGDQSVGEDPARSPRVAFHLVRQQADPVDEKSAQLAASEGQLDALCDDPLSADALADDPNHRDPLQAPATRPDSGTVTLGTDGPSRSR